jgi:hypothetical protein
MSRLQLTIFNTKLRGWYAVVAMTLIGGLVGWLMGAISRLLIYALAIAIAAAIKAQLKAKTEAVTGGEEEEEDGEGDEEGEDDNGDDNGDDPKPEPGPGDDPAEDRRVAPGLTWDVGRLTPSGVTEGPRPTGMVTKAVGGNERESAPVGVPSVAKDSRSRGGRGKRRKGSRPKPVMN